jgi:hypothetical protein
MALSKSPVFATLQLAPYLFRMTVFLGCAVAVAAILIVPILEAFNANPFLNGLILAALLLGVLNAYRIVYGLRPDIRWIASVRRTDPGMTPVSALTPNLLSPLANMLAEQRGRLSLSAPAARSVLDGVQSRLDESRDIARYMTGLLVFLGLLGTFWGLILVVNSVAGAIEALPSGAAGGGVSFDQLRAGLEAPLKGMGTAFSSSLFGLAGSLILGFLDLQAGQAQNRFYTSLEEWMSTVTRLGGGHAASVTEGETSAPAYLTALLEQTAENLENLERTLSRLETHRSGDGEAARETAAAMRGVEAAMRRIAEESSAGRETFVSELRQEIKLLGRTLAAMGDKAKG